MAVFLVVHELSRLFGLQVHSATGEVDVHRGGQHRTRLLDNLQKEYGKHLNKYLISHTITLS